MNLSATLLFVLVAPAQLPDFPTGRTIRDRWEVLEVQGAQIGTLHTEIQSLDTPRSEGKNSPARKIRETMTLDLKRFNETVKLKQVREDLESNDGYLLGSKMEQFQGNQLQLSLEAKPQGDTWVMTNHKNRASKSMTLAQRPVGLAKLQEQMEKQQTGAVLHYEPMVNTFILTEIQHQPGRDPNSFIVKPRTLSGDRLPIEDSKFLVDTKGEFSEREFDLPSLGRIKAVPSNRAEALKPKLKTLDIGSLGLISLNRTIPSHPSPSRVIYRLHADEGIDLGQTIAADERQQVRVLSDGFVELTTLPSKAPARRISPPPAKEFSSPSKIIDFTNPFIQQMAQRSGAYEGDSWTAAKRLEKYVHSLLIPDASAPLGSAADAAQARRGDCRHAAILLCALCRAAAIPARTCAGLVYIERTKPGGGRGPFLGFHMWTEVYIDGQWIGLDGTLGKGGVSPRHIKINDQSWFQEESMAPLAPVLKLVGKLQAEVLMVDANP